MCPQREGRQAGRRWGKGKVIVIENFSLSRFGFGFGFSIDMHVVDR